MRVYIVVVLYVALTQSFYLRPGYIRNNWWNAELYCIDTCKSHLASIHNENDFNSIKYLLQTDGYWEPGSSEGSAWFGLRRISQSNFSYIDGTPFDFGDNKNYSTRNTDHPWLSGQPNNPNTQYGIRFREGVVTYNWEAKPFGSTFFVICNDCHPSMFYCAALIDAWKCVFSDMQTIRRRSKLVSSINLFYPMNLIKI